MQSCGATAGSCRTPQLAASRLPREQVASLTLRLMGRSEGELERMASALQGAEQPGGTRSSRCCFGYIWSLPVTLPQAVSPLRGGRQCQAWSLPGAR